MRRSLTFLSRYLWSLLLLLAAFLAHDTGSSITLGMVALVYTVLVSVREHRLRRTADNLGRRLGKVQRQLLLTLIAAELVLFATTLLTNGPVAEAKNYAVLLLVALAPLGLEAEIAVLLRSRSSETVQTAIDYATEDAKTLLSIIALSFVGSTWLHIPPALSVLQILVITCIARPLLSGRALQSAPHKADQPWRTLFAAVTVYGSYLFFYLRHYFSPKYLDIHNPITWRATSVTLVTFIACQAAMLLFNPRAPKNAVIKASGLLVLVVAVIYVPLTHTYFMTHSITSLDWFCIMIATLFYTALCLLQGFTKTHNRKAVLALHKSTQ